MNKKNAMSYVDESNENILIRYSCFRGKTNVDEYHFTLVPVSHGTLSEQVALLDTSYKKILKKVGLNPSSAVFRRFFCSDLVNQYQTIKKYPVARTEKNHECALSFVSQAPYPEAKISLWAYHIVEKHPLLKSKDGSGLKLTRNSLTHFWDTGLISPEKPEVDVQTTDILSKYKKLLSSRKMKLSDNVIRTWFFVKNIDTDYMEFAKDRKEFFEKNGLTPATHFIASTGVEGSGTNIKARILLDAYSIAGIKPDQIQFLSDSRYLSPTYIYGVTFERGVVINYRDRKHIMISGTASINKKGDIVYPGNVVKQLHRTLKNIEVLLKNAHAGFNDVCVFIVYVRDASDVKIIYNEMRKNFCNVPIQFVVASVCRPGWLVEIECQAICDAVNPDFPDF